MLRVNGAGAIGELRGHQFVFDEGSSRCVRCRVKWSSRNQERMCKVPSFGDLTEDRWNGYLSRLKARWSTRWERHRGDHEEGGRELRTREGNDTEPELCGLRCWKKHRLVEGNGKVVCLDCGMFFSAMKSVLGVHRARWVHLPCAGKRKIPKVLQLLLNAGTFDATAGHRG